MGRCKDCKSWGSWLGIDAVCERPDDLWPKDIPEGQQFSIDCEADDDQGLQAWLRTGPEFGCVRFEERLDK